jgi:hypothetical protein
MPRKEKESLQSLLRSLKDKANEAAAAVNSTIGRIPSIIEFCEGKEYLGLPYLEPEVHLYPMQRLILKAFYRGSEGNDGPDSEFTPEEIEYMREIGLDKDDPRYQERGDVVGKINNGQIFRELVLVWGRRSGKDFIVSVIALYEAMKLLESPGGDPYAKYKLQRGGNPITILTVANSASQATIAFNEMKAKLMSSNYFRGKFIPEGVTGSSIYLQTAADIRDNRDRAKRGLQPERGSIMIRAGHSNSDSLLGIQCFVLLLDEVASFRATDGASGGNRIYEAMLPSLNTFVRDDTEKETGAVVMDPDTGKPQKVFDSKVISISSPRGKDGILYKMFKDADQKKDRLVCRLPTWVVNVKYTREALRASFAQFNDERFNMEFGADFSGHAGTNFFDETKVKECFRAGARFRDRGLPGIVYFAHLDPATSSHNYTLAICHREVYVNPETHKADFYVILDHLRIWTPRPEKPIIIDEIDSYILMMNQHFHIGLVTYDLFNSVASLQKLRRAGIPCKLTHYNKSYKMQIYDQLEMLVNERRLILPHNQTLENELVNLQRRYDSGRGYSVFPNRECETPTDDACDALAGAAFNCFTTQVNRLPSTRLVSLPSTGQAGATQFRSMQGPAYGPRVLDHMRARGGGGGAGFGINPYRGITPPPRPGY